MVKLAARTLADTFQVPYTPCFTQSGSAEREVEMSESDLGFTFRKLKNGDVVISHQGRSATTLRGDRASDFLEDMQGTDLESQQQEMARITGNYRRGNERLAKQHPRNR